MTVSEMISDGMSRSEIAQLYIAAGMTEEYADFTIALELGEIEGDYVDLNADSVGEDVKNAGPLAEIGRLYTESLNRHIEQVKASGRKIGVSDQQLMQHDASKWTEAEFWPYAINFYGTDDQKEANRSQFDQAWLHHMHSNPHHWQHWLLNLDDGQVRPLRMPDAYALEMVADWRGASLAYTDSADMTKWLNKRFNGIVLHDDTRAYVLRVLREKLGYEIEQVRVLGVVVYEFSHPAPADS